MKRFVPGVMMMVLGAGCGIEGSDTTPEKAQTPAAVLESVQRDNGNVVEFLQLEDGEVVVMETGLYPNPPSAIDGIGPAEAWSKLTGRSDVPNALGVAQQRYELMRANPSLRDAEGASERGESIVRDGQAAGTTAAAYGPCDITWFQDNFCNAAYDWKMCLTNWSGGAYAQRSGVEYHKTAVCPTSGNVTLNIKDQVIRNVGAGGYLWYYRSGSNFDFRADVDNASGDTFHFAVNLNY
ncbi:hypothetical protein [Pyxidicoccus trucidator]|uniref:hypothetical protein n=1 Tax=Pyxidicoccus trucidator TaxID=2709662 RepID=UPI0013DA7A10|nr:hypothetical protein [Pyxidicoccus trucidator]